MVIQVKKNQTGEIQLRNGKGTILAVITKAQAKSLARVLIAASR